MDRLKLKKVKLDKRSIYLRELIISGLEGGKRGHVGSSMSLVEILRVLYDHIAKINFYVPYNMLFRTLSIS